MPQPPNLQVVGHVLERASVIHGPEVSADLGELLAEAWRYAGDHDGEPASQALWTATQLLVMATKLRRRGQVSLANMCDHLAESAVLGWLDELAVGTTEVPDHP